MSAERVRRPRRVEPVRAGRGVASVELAPVRSTRIYQAIIGQVQAMIGEGRLRAGDRLPPERDLAERFVVSRTSVREALRALESLGLLEVRPGDGTFVRHATGEALVEPLARAIASQREAIGELFEARRLLEPAIAALAARRATPDELDEMVRILDAQARAVASGGTGLGEDARFHAAIAEAAHNRAISRLVEELMGLLTQSREESLSTPGRPEQSHRNHRNILRALAARQPLRAATAMRRHLAAVEALVVGVGQSS